MPRLGLLLVLIACLAASPFLFSLLQNNNRLNRLEDRFLALRRPASSELVLRFSKVGRLHGGNDDKCSFVVGEVRSAPGDLGPVVASYAGISIEGALSGGRGGGRRCELRAQPLSPNFEVGGAAAFGFHDHEIMAQVGALARKRNDLYLVLCADTMHPAGFDPRCR